MRHHVFHVGDNAAGFHLDENIVRPRGGYFDGVDGKVRTHRVQPRRLSINFLPIFSATLLIAAMSLPEAKCENACEDVARYGC